MKRVLFICLGNICRSPIAEGIFNSLIIENNLQGELETDSAGTASYHIDEKPDYRSVKVLQKYDMDTKHIGRRIGSDDFEKFDLILVMDSNNYRSVQHLNTNPEYQAKIQYLTDYQTEGTKMDMVPDPYYGGMSEFEDVFNLCLSCCKNVIEAYKEGKF